MKKPTPKHWAAVVNTTPFKSICQLVEREGDTTKVIAGEVSDANLANYLSGIPNDIKILEAIIDYLYEKEKVFYIANTREDITPIFKHVAYLKERIEAFRKIYGDLPLVEGIIREYKPIIEPE